jgi:hypothetical protein
MLASPSSGQGGDGGHGGGGSGQGGTGGVTTTSSAICEDPITFVKSAEVAVGNSPMGTAVADLDGDGHLDLAVLTYLATNDARLRVARGQGDGTFAPFVDVYAYDPSAYGFGYAILAADLDGDGRPDLAWAGHEQVVVFANQGGSFVAPTAYSVGKGCTALAAADLNGDGLMDLVTTNGEDKSVSVLLNAGKGVFAPAVTYPLAWHATGVFVADLNGDGHPDLAVDHGSIKGLALLFNDGNGTFAPAVAVPVLNAGRLFGAPDLNGDGAPDLVISVMNADLNRTIAVLWNQGAGTFTPPTDVGAEIGYALSAADLDGDGRPDLAQAPSASGALSVRRNQGGGSFPVADSFDLAANASDLIAADVNGDGRVDLVLPTSDPIGDNNGTVRVLLNQTCLP